LDTVLVMTQQEADQMGSLRREKPVQETMKSRQSTLRSLTFSKKRYLYSKINHSDKLNTQYRNIARSKETQIRQHQRLSPSRVDIYFDP